MINEETRKKEDMDLYWNLFWFIIFIVFLVIGGFMTNKILMDKGIVENCKKKQETKIEEPIDSFDPADPISPTNMTNPGNPNNIYNILGM